MLFLSSLSLISSIKDRMASANGLELYKCQYMPLSLMTNSFTHSKWGDIPLSDESSCSIVNEATWQVSKTLIRPPSRSAITSCETVPLVVIHGDGSL